MLEGEILKRDSGWMLISGIIGFSFFLISNFTQLFTGSAVIAGFCQLAINTFVFIVWGRIFLRSSGFKKLVAFIGTVFPIIMASITLWRVLIPWITN